MKEDNCEKIHDENRNTGSIQNGKLSGQRDQIDEQRSEKIVSPNHFANMNTSGLFSDQDPPTTCTSALVRGAAGGESAVVKGGHSAARPMLTGSNGSTCPAPRQNSTGHRATLHQTLGQACPKSHASQTLTTGYQTTKQNQVPGQIQIGQDERKKSFQMEIPEQSSLLPKVTKLTIPRADDDDPDMSMNDVGIPPPSTHPHPHRKQYGNDRAAGGSLVVNGRQGMYGSIEGQEVAWCASGFGSFVQGGQENGQQITRNQNIGSEQQKSKQMSSITKQITYPHNHTQTNPQSTGIPSPHHDSSHPQQSKNPPLTSSNSTNFMKHAKNLYQFIVPVAQLNLNVNNEGGQGQLNYNVTRQTKSQAQGAGPGRFLPPRENRLFGDGPLGSSAQRGNRSHKRDLSNTNSNHTGQHFAQIDSITNNDSNAGSRQLTYAQYQQMKNQRLNFLSYKEQQQLKVDSSSNLLSQRSQVVDQNSKNFSFVQNNAQTYRGEPKHPIGDPRRALLPSQSQLLLQAQRSFDPTHDRTQQQYLNTDIIAPHLHGKEVMKNIDKIHNKFMSKLETPKNRCNSDIADIKVKLHDIYKLRVTIHSVQIDVPASIKMVVQCVYSHRDRSQQVKQTNQKFKVEQVQTGKKGESDHKQLKIADFKNSELVLDVLNEVKFSTTGQLLPSDPTDYQTQNSRTDISRDSQSTKTIPPNTQKCQIKLLAVSDNKSKLIGLYHYQFVAKTKERLANNQEIEGTALFKPIQRSTKLFQKSIDKNASICFSTELVPVKVNTFQDYKEEVKRVRREEHQKKKNAYSRIDFNQADNMGYDTNLSRENSENSDRMIKNTGRIPRSAADLKICDQGMMSQVLPTQPTPMKKGVKNIQTSQVNMRMGMATGATSCGHGGSQGPPNGSQEDSLRAGSNQELNSNQQRLNVSKRNSQNQPEIGDLTGDNGGNQLQNLAHGKTMADGKHLTLKIQSNSELDREPRTSQEGSFIIVNKPIDDAQDEEIEHFKATESTRKNQNALKIEFPVDIDQNQSKIHNEDGKLLLITDRLNTSVNQKVAGINQMQPSSVSPIAKATGKGLLNSNNLTNSNEEALVSEEKKVNEQEQIREFMQNPKQQNQIPNKHKPEGSNVTQAEQLNEYSLNESKLNNKPYVVPNSVEKVRRQNTFEQASQQTIISQINKTPRIMNTQPYRQATLPHLNKAISAEPPRAVVPDKSCDPETRRDLSQNGEQHNSLTKTFSTLYQGIKVGVNTVQKAIEQQQQYAKQNRAQKGLMFNNQFGNEIYYQQQQQHLKRSQSNNLLLGTNASPSYHNYPPSHFPQNLESEGLRVGGGAGGGGANKFGPQSQKIQISNFNNQMAEAKQQPLSLQTLQSEIATLQQEKQFLQTRLNNQQQQYNDQIALLQHKNSLQSKKYNKRKEQMAQMREEVMQQMEKYVQIQTHNENEFKDEYEYMLYLYNQQEQMKDIFEEKFVHAVREREALEARHIVETEKREEEVKREKEQMEKEWEEERDAFTLKQNMHQQELVALANEKEERIKQDAIKDQEIINLKEEVSKLKSEVGATQQLMKKDYHTHKKDMEEVCKEKELRETEMSEIKEKYQDLIHVHKNTEKDLQEAHTQRDKLTRQYQDALEQISLLQHQNQILQEERSTVEKERRTRLDEDNLKNQEVEELKEHNQELVERLRITETQLIQVKSSWAESECEREQMQMQVQDQEDRLYAQTEQIKQLKQQIQQIEGQKGLIPSNCQQCRHPKSILES